jgi:hypothetical protein
MVTSVPNAQIAREVLRDAAAPLRAGAVRREVLRDAPAPVRVGLVVREILRDAPIMGGDGGGLSVLW